MRSPSMEVSMCAIRGNGIFIFINGPAAKYGPLIGNDDGPRVSSVQMCATPENDTRVTVRLRVYRNSITPPPTLVSFSRVAH